MDEGDTIIPNEIREHLAKGIEVRGKTIRIVFVYAGVRCRESLRGYSQITKAVINYAVNKRNAILVEIAENRFNYLAHFPESKKAKELSGVKKQSIFVKDGVSKWLTKYLKR